MDAPELQSHLRRLTAERLDAIEAGLAGNEAYMAELDEDLAETRDAYVGMAVTEIAALRAQLSGRQVG